MLFGGRTIHEIVETINTVWLDPDYVLVIVAALEHEQTITITTIAA